MRLSGWRAAAEGGGGSGRGSVFSGDFFFFFLGSAPPTVTAAITHLVALGVRGPATDAAMGEEIWVGAAERVAPTPLQREA